MILIDRYRCGYCGTCVSVCPKDAAVLVGTWLRIDKEKCNSCEVCVNLCPVGALAVELEQGEKTGVNLN